MFFFNKPARPRSRRAPSAVKSRLRVEQLETRLTPALVLDSPLMTVASAPSSGPSPALGAPAVATDTAGDYVVTWSSTGQNGSGWGIYAQRYSSSGAPQGTTTRVNTTTVTAGYQQDPSVAMDSVGDYVVTWSSYGQDGSGWGVYGQLYNAIGVAQGGEFRVNTTTAGDQLHARVAMDSAGNFVVTWASNQGGGWGIYAQRYGVGGVALGAEFGINDATPGDKQYPAVAINGTGSFVVTWSSYGQDGSGWGVYARRYAPIGIPQGHEFLVNTTTAGDQMYSSVAMDAAGDCVISWSSYGQDGSGWGVYAQRYNYMGLAQGSEFLVNTTTRGDQTYSAVAMDGMGNFVITWSSNQTGSWGTYGQQFSAGGVAQGSEFQIGAAASSSVTYSAVAMTATGRIVIVCNGLDAYANSCILALLR